MHSGRIAELWRYPVKSMQGERIEESSASERGLFGDRTHAVLDRETGLIASAKHPRRWKRLIECRARFASEPSPGRNFPPVVITLPAGSETASDEPDVDQKLSQALGREVSLTVVTNGALAREADRSELDAIGSGAVVKHESLNLAAPSGSFFDVAPIHLVTTATLDRLRELHPGGMVDPRRFRPNLVVAVRSEEPFPELGWLGHEIELGSTVRVRVIDPCPRCVASTLAQSELRSDPALLRTLTTHTRAVSVTLAPGTEFRGVAGVYATVLQGGSVVTGDRASVP